MAVAAKIVWQGNTNHKTGKVGGQNHVNHAFRGHMLMWPNRPRVKVVLRGSSKVISLNQAAWMFQRRQRQARLPPNGTTWQIEKSEPLL
jgi:hypothetical protein